MQGDEGEGRRAVPALARQQGTPEEDRHERRLEGQAQVDDEERGAAERSHCRS
jgi:hypothetical protein